MTPYALISLQRSKVPSRRVVPRNSYLILTSTFVGCFSYLCAVFDDARENTGALDVDVFPFDERVGGERLRCERVDGVCARTNTNC